MIFKWWCGNSILSILGRMLSGKYFYLQSICGLIPLSWQVDINVLNNHIN